eukprot:jgi/Pico_ML_1/53288/g3860.t1
MDATCASCDVDDVYKGRASWKELEGPARTMLKDMSVKELVGAKEKRVLVLEHDESVGEALVRMAERKVLSAPVVVVSEEEDSEEGVVTNIISQTDVIRYIYKHVESLGRLRKRMREKEGEVAVETRAYEDQTPGPSGLKEKTRAFLERPYYLHNFVQATFDCLGAKKLKGSTLLVSGDGRYYNAEALQIVLKIASANKVKKVIEKIITLA